MKTKIIEMPCSATLAPNAIDAFKKAINTGLYMTDIKFVFNKNEPEKSVFLAVMEDKPPQKIMTKEEIYNKEQSLTKLDNKSSGK